MSARELIRTLERAGWITVRQRGSHRVMAHPERPATILVVPDRGSKELPRGVVMRLLREAGLR